MNEQLLLVEDDDAIAAALRLHLEEAGYRLHRESDGLQAMASIDRQRWDMVLLDLMLPGADGWDVCRHLRARHADVPVIMLSARSADTSSGARRGGAATAVAWTGEARAALLSMLMVVNPGIQVYVLDADGRVQAYIGDPGMVRQEQGDLQAVRNFLAGAALPLRGTDPMGSGVPRIFSAAMFPPRVGDSRPPGYLYVVLDGPAREQVAGQLSLRRVWQGAGLVAAAGMLVTLLVGVFVFRRLTQPLHRLAGRLRDYSLRSLNPSTLTVVAHRRAGRNVAPATR